MASRLSNTIFQTNGRQAMIVQDAYQVSSGETRNGLFEASKGVYSSTVGALYSNPDAGQNLARLIVQSRGGNVNKADMFERALSAMGTSLPALLGTIGGALKNQLGDAADALIGPGSKKSVDIIYNNLGKIAKTASVTDLAGLAQVVNELTGNSELMKVINIEAEAAVIGGIAQQLLRYGVPDLIDEVMAMSASKDAVYKAWQFVSQDSVVGTDLTLINKIIDTIGLTGYLEANPNAINTILNTFYLGTADTADTWPAKRLLLLNTLNRIDAHWEEYNRNGTYVKKLNAFTSASTDAKKLFMLAQPESTLCMVAPAYPVTNVTSVVKAMYPDAYIS